MYAWIVVINPRSMPNASCSTLASGARQFVVHEAFEMIVCWSASYASSFTPMTTVKSTFVAGAEMITLRAPPAMCAFACSPSVKKPVDSITTSTS